MDGIQYKVNITALVDDCRASDSKGQESARMSVESSGFAESKALHEKVRRVVSNCFDDNVHCKVILMNGSLNVHMDETSGLVERQSSDILG